MYGEEIDKNPLIREGKKEMLDDMYIEMLHRYLLDYLAGYDAKH